MRRSAHARRGYILLMTLLLIPLTAVALASLERLSLTRALEANRTERTLQRRWLVTTLQATLLKNAPQILDSASSDEPVLLRTATVTIGGCPVAMVITDEQAKANVNALWNTRDSESCREAVQRLLDPAMVSFVLQPTPKELPGLYGEAAFGRYGQVFPRIPPADLLGSPLRPEGPATALTLWGSGRLNFQRATPAALRQVCAPVLGPADVEKILALRRAQPALGTLKLLSLLSVSKEQRSTLVERLTDRSDCFGLWVVLQEPEGSRYHFAATYGGVTQRDSW